MRICEGLNRSLCLILVILLFGGCLQSFKYNAESMALARMLDNPTGGVYIFNGKRKMLAEDINKHAALFDESKNSPGAHLEIELRDEWTKYLHNKLSVETNKRGSHEYLCDEYTIGVRINQFYKLYDEGHRKFDGN